MNNLSNVSVVVTDAHFTYKKEAKVIAHEFLINEFKDHGVTLSIGLIDQVHQKFYTIVYTYFIKYEERWNNAEAFLSAEMVINFISDNIDSLSPEAVNEELIYFILQ